MSRQRIAIVSIFSGWSLAVALSPPLATGGELGMASVLAGATSAARATERARDTVPSTIDYVDGTVGED